MPSEKTYNIPLVPFQCQQNELFDTHVCQGNRIIHRLKICRVHAVLLFTILASEHQHMLEVQCMVSTLSKLLMVSK